MAKKSEQRKPGSGGARPGSGAPKKQPGKSYSVHVPETTLNNVRSRYDKGELADKVRGFITILSNAPEDKDVKITLANKTLL